jgi:hypothetical protein
MPNPNADPAKRIKPCSADVTLVVTSVRTFASIWAHPVQTGQHPQAGHRPGRLADRQLEQHLEDQVDWIAASENTAGRSRLPSCSAIQLNFWFDKIGSHPRLPSADI